MNSTLAATPTVGGGGKAPEALRKPPVFAWVLALLTAVIALALSHYRLLWYDEILVIWTDSVSTVGRLLHVQRTWPISLDPMVYPLVAHSLIRLLGASAFVVRLPSMVGFGVMQLCIFVFVARIAGRHAGLIAMIYPTITACFYFAVEARPYGMMLGLVGIAMIAWQTAVRRDGRRLGALIALACAIALTLNVHYYGVLMLVPICGAEALRWFENRRVDLAVFASIVIGASGIVFTLPFMRGASQFGIHSFAPPVTGALLSQAYLYLLPTLEPQHKRTFLLLCAIVLLSLWMLTKSKRRSSAKPELLFLLLLAAVPIIGYMFGKFLVHVFLFRYVIEGVIGLSALFAIPIGSFFKRERYSVALLSCLVLILAVFGSNDILNQRKKNRAVMADLMVSPEVKGLLLKGSDGRIYFQDIQEFAQATYYEPDPELKSRMVLLFSAQEEIRWRGRDTDSLTAIHLKNFHSEFPSETFETVAFSPLMHVIISYPHDSNVDWTAKAFAEHHTIVTPMLPALDGVAEAVRASPQLITPQ